MSSGSPFLISPSFQLAGKLSHPCGSLQVIGRGSSAATAVLQGVAANPSLGQILCIRDGENGKTLHLQSPADVMMAGQLP